MDVKIYFSVILLTVFHSLCGVLCVTFNETRDVHEQIVTFYANNNKSLTSIIPLEDLSQPITVQLTLCLYSVDGFDAVSGQIDISASVYMEWKDETMAASIGYFNFTGFDIGYSVTLSPSAIWTPTVVLLNAVDSVKRVGDQSYKVRYLVADGRAKWQPRAVIQASCKPNVKYYPFDRQDCSFIYTAWGYTTDELVLDIAQSDWYLCDYTANAIWALIETSAEGYVKNSQSYIKFKFTIERQPQFFVLNIILPLVLLALLDGFVFLLPAESGERVGFCVTCFLSFVFMLQTVLSFLPQTAEPMSMLCFYIVIMMVASIAQCIVTIVMLRIYHKPEDARVPGAVQRLAAFISCAWIRGACQRRSTASRGSESPPADSERPLSLGSIGIVDGHASFSQTNKVRPFPDNFMDVSASTSYDADASFSATAKASSTPTSIEKPPPFPFNRAPGTSKHANDFRRSSTSNISRELPRGGGASEMGSGEDVSGDRDAPDDVAEMKWPDVGRAFDTFFFFLFTGFQMLFTMGYLSTGIHRTPDIAVKLRNKMAEACSKAPDQIYYGLRVYLLYRGTKDFQGYSRSHRYTPIK